MTRFICILISLLSLNSSVWADNALNLTQLAQRYESNCPRLEDNYSYSQLQKYAQLISAAKPSPDDTQISDVTEYYALDNSEFIKATAKTPACILAMADNLVDGMNYYMATRPKTAFQYNETRLHMAYGYLMKWLFDSAEIRDAALSKADEAIRRYLDEDDSTFMAEKKPAYMFAAEGYRTAASMSPSTANAVVLLDKAIALGNEGLERSQDKSEALFALKGAYADKIAVYKIMNTDSAPVAIAAIDVLRPYVDVHSDLELYIAELQFQMGNTTEGKTLLERVAQDKVFMETLCSTVKKAFFVYLYPETALYMMHNVAWGRNYLHTVCPTQGQ